MFQQSIIQTSQFYKSNNFSQIYSRSVELLRFLFFIFSDERVLWNYGWLMIFLWFGFSFSVSKKKRDLMAQNYWRFLFYSTCDYPFLQKDYFICCGLSFMVLMRQKPCCVKSILTIAMCTETTNLTKANWHLIIQVS